ncbi:hypothetical protein C366_01463 [Cryptococcus neoformans Tu401-1]|nr:hypothetical protein C366_01463 [Cryptococcus neoformans var. grubii Tu401-1]
MSHLPSPPLSTSSAPPNPWWTPRQEDGYAHARQAMKLSIGSAAALDAAWLEGQPPKSPSPPSPGDLSPPKGPPPPEPMLALQVLARVVDSSKGRDKFLKCMQYTLKTYISPSARPSPASPSPSPPSPSSANVSSSSTPSTPSPPSSPPPPCPPGRCSSISSTSQAPSPTTPSVSPRLASSGAISDSAPKHGQTASGYSQPSSPSTNSISTPSPVSKRIKLGSTDSHAYHPSDKSQEEKQNNS